MQSLLQSVLCAPSVRAPGDPLPASCNPWSHIALDFVTSLPESGGMTTILTLVDRFSKMVHFIALPKLPSAKETAEVLPNQVFRLHGLPRDIVSDWGPQFIAKFWAELCKLLGISVNLSLGLHPETNGQSERLNQQLETGLRILCSHKPSSWTKNLVWVEYAHNSLPSAATSLTPFQTVYGYQPPLFSSQEDEVLVRPRPGSPLPPVMATRPADPPENNHQL